MQGRLEALDTELNAARRTAQDLYGHAGELRARLVAAGVAETDIAPVPEPRRVEAQLGLDVRDD